MNEKVIMKKGILLAICCLSLLPLRAQDGDFEAPPEGGPKRTSGIMGYFSFGGHQNDISELNEMLFAASQPDFNANGLSMGGGGYLIRKNFIIGGEGQTFLTKRAENDSSWASLEGGEGLFRLGYLLLSKPKFFLYPAVGVGGMNYTLTLQPKDSLPAFQQLAQDPRYMTRITAKSLILDFSLNFNLFVIGDGNNGGGLSLGLTGGYTLSPTDVTWKLGESDLPSPPANTFTGPYVRLNVTGGGVFRN